MVRSLAYRTFQLSPEHVDVCGRGNARAAGGLRVRLPNGFRPARQLRQVAPRNSAGQDGGGEEVQVHADDAHQLAGRRDRGLATRPDAVVGSGAVGRRLSEVLQERILLNPPRGWNFKRFHIR